jgi:hypothetical protein
LAYGNAAGTNTMLETVAIDGPPVAKRAATVSASALALHLDCSRSYIGKLEAEGVIQRQGDGFPLDQSRVAYLRYLRRERRQSPRSEADADHVKVQLRLMEKKRELVRQDDVNELIDQIAGVTLTAFSSLPARCAPRGDLATRRSIEGSYSRCAPRLPTSASLVAIPDVRFEATRVEHRAKSKSADAL